MTNELRQAIEAVCGILRQQQGADPTVTAVDISINAKSWGVTYTYGKPEDTHEHGTPPEDICGLCGKPGADKMAHPMHWPGEAVPDTDLVHQECERAECKRAHAALSPAEREAVLRTI